MTAFLRQHQVLVPVKIKLALFHFLSNVDPKNRQTPGEDGGFFKAYLPRVKLRFNLVIDS